MSTNYTKKHMNKTIEKKSLIFTLNMLVYLIVKLAEASHSSIYPKSFIFFAEKPNLRNKKNISIKFFLFHELQKLVRNNHLIIVLIFDLHFRKLLKSKLITHKKRLKFNTI